MSDSGPELLKASIRVIEAKKALVAETFYEHLFRNAPHMQDHFREVDMSTQGQMVVQTILLAAEGADHFQELAPSIEGLGFRHLQYGVSPEILPLAVDAFIATLEDILGEDFTPELESTWREMLTTVVDTMIRGTTRAVERAAAVDETRKFFPANLEESDPYLARFLPVESPPEQPRSRGDSESEYPKSVSVEYVGEKTIEAAPLQTLLDVSLDNQIPHLHECGAVAKCSTCRVLIVEGLENCLPRNQLETDLAREKGFPPEVRLACQTRFVGPIRMRRLIRDVNDANEAICGGRISAGREMKLAVLFCDLRSFTTFSEQNFPYDVVHALNRHFNAMGEVIDRHGGYIDKYMGDEIMALFGLAPGREAHPCVEAVRAALGMVSQMPEVNQYLGTHLGREFQIGIGISYGTAIVGEVGFRLKKQLTAIGDVVNVASRLQSQTKLLGAEILASDPVRGKLMKGDCTIGRSLDLSLAGKSKPILAHELLPAPPAP